jgi:chitinase
MTVASPAGPKNYGIQDLKAMDSYLDAWHLMAYDYSGGWDTIAGHGSNLYGSTKNPASTPYNTQQAVEAYIERGISPNKIIMGIPLYGRSFEGTSGFGESYSGVGAADNISGSWEAGAWDYKALPKAGAIESFDKSLGASWSYDDATREIITYDNVQAVQLKASYIKDKGLGGAMYWESSGDKSGRESLIGNVAKAFGELEQSENWLNYPGSKYANMAAGMPRE